MTSARWGAPKGSTLVNITDRNARFPDDDVLLQFSNGSVWMVRVLQVVRVADGNVDQLMKEGMR